MSWRKKRDRTEVFVIKKRLETALDLGYKTCDPVVKDFVKKKTD